MGSGTTAVACALSKRKFIGFENDAQIAVACYARIKEVCSDIKIRPEFYEFPGVVDALLKALKRSKAEFTRKHKALMKEYRK